MKSGPFSELEDGIPVWRIQVDDPHAAMDAPLRLLVRVLPLPLGSVAAMALELSDVKGGRPSYHHVCGAWAHPDLQVWFTALRWGGKVRLRFEHAGWMSDAHKDVDVELAPPPAGVADKDADAAVRDYAAFYREQFPKLKSPEAVWEACLGQAQRPAAAVEAAAWKKWAWAVGLIALAALVYFALLATGLHASPAFFNGSDVAGSLEREDAHGWTRDPSLLAQAPAWRVGLTRSLRVQSFNDQGEDTLSNGGEVIWGLGSLGSLGLAGRVLESENFTLELAGDTPRSGSLLQMGWGWAAGGGFSLGSGVAMGRYVDAMLEHPLTSASLGAHWTHPSGQTLGVHADYSNPGGEALAGLAGYGRLFRRVGYTWGLETAPGGRQFWRVGLDSRTALRLSASYGNGEGLVIGLAWNWHGGHLAWYPGDRSNLYALSWQAYEATQATQAAEPDNSPPLIPDVDPAPTAPVE